VNRHLGKWQAFVRRGTGGARRRRHGAFTIFELLAVITVLTVLLTILLPALQGARERARQVMCVSNLHQLGMGLQHYGVDNRQKIPLLSIQQHGFPFIGEWFLYYREGYLGTDTLVDPANGPRDLKRLGEQLPVFDCPSTGMYVDFCYCGPNGTGYGPGGWTKPQAKTFDYMMGYGHVTSGGEDHGLNGARIQELKGDTILLIDHEEKYSWCAQDGAAGSVWNIYHATGGAPYIPGFHHNGGANVLTISMSARWHTRLDYQPDWESGAMWMKEFLAQ
jgi:type II secretory pathway pseudopilin PulG